MSLDFKKINDELNPGRRIKQYDPSPRIFIPQVSRTPRGKYTRWSFTPLVYVIVAILLLVIVCLPVAQIILSAK